MDMSFTKNPEWIAERQKLWDECVDSLGWSEELSKKQITDLHEYFMTGVLKKGSPSSVAERILFFPRVNIESVEHVLKYNIPEGVADKDIADLKAFFSAGIEYVPNLSAIEASEIFKYVFGESYSEVCQIPFIINDETTYRQVTLDANSQFDCGINVLSWLKNENKYRSICYHLIDYWFSLFNHVDPRIFSSDRSTKVRHVNMKLFPKLLRRFLGFSAHAIDISKGADWGEERRQYMQDFRERMDNLDGPQELLELWSNVKETDPSEFHTIE